MKLNRFAKDLLAGKWVEIMRAGTWNRTTFSVDDLKKIAEEYDANFRVAPLVVGHPSMLEVEGERAAHGVIADLRVVADSLQARIENLSDEVRQGLQSGKWISRSIEAMKFGKGENRSWYLTGLALLGGSQPAVDAMLSEDSEKLCVECPESKSPEIDNSNQPLLTKGSTMNPEELARLKAVEDKLAAQAAESVKILAAVEKQTEALTALTTKVEGLTALKTDYDALSASTSALVDAQAQLAVNEATKGIPKALCPDEKKLSLLSLYKTDRKAFDVESGICSALREKFSYVTKEVVTDDAGQPVVVNASKPHKYADAGSVSISQKAAELRAKDANLSIEESIKQASREVSS